MTEGDSKTSRWTTLSPSAYFLTSLKNVFRLYRSGIDISAATQISESNAHADNRLEATASGASAEPALPDLNLVRATSEVDDIHVDIHENMTRRRFLDDAEMDDAEFFPMFEMPGGGVERGHEAPICYLIGLL